jgi:L-fuconolactonase
VTAKPTAGFPKIKEGRDEPILEPGIPIIDSHHHLFDRPALRYMVEDYLEDAKLGHDIRATVYIETQAFARADGPEVLRPVGEVEFANGVGAIGRSGVYGSCRVAAAIVGFADMRLGERVQETLDRSIAAAPDRFRGVRQIALAHSDPAVLRFLTHKPPPDLLRDPAFGEAFLQLGRRGLSFSATVLHPQLPELAALAARHEDTLVVLDHLGLATAMDGDAAARAEAFTDWRGKLKDLAQRPNVVCKIGGLGTMYWGFGFNRREQPATSAELAAAWKPYVETAIDAFGPERCMMESNYPNDGRSCGFVPLWNALKRIVAGASAAEKKTLFHDTAARIYRIEAEAS